MYLFFALSLLFSPLSQEESNQLARKIFQNECGSKREKLVWWNNGEEFASLGIGHFIWYPQGNKGRFEETFPTLLSSLKEEGISIPEWVLQAKGCPWRTREEFNAPSEKMKKEELCTLLERTFPQQTAFIESRFERALARLLSEEITGKIKALSQSAKGRFALIDYCNFKGDGTQESERYKGQGWGLKQVLEEMNGTDVESFVAAAKEVLRRRVENAPPERGEQRWLPGWIARLENYLKR